MSETNQPPTPARQHAERDGYQCWYYGGWVSEVSIRRAGKIVTVFKQEKAKPFVLPTGADKPFTVFQTELSGPDLPRVSVTLDDPDHVVERIELVLKRKDGAAQDGGDDDGWTINNTPTLCPPTC
jgi:hypothetical protein